VKNLLLLIEKKLQYQLNTSSATVCSDDTRINRSLIDNQIYYV